jgi:hypothetical protein
MAPEAISMNRMKSRMGRMFLIGGEVSPPPAGGWYAVSAESDTP